MKRIILFITILVFLFKTGHGQTNVYHPFPDSNAVWQVSWTSGSLCTYSPPYQTSMLYAEYQYTLGGDTTIGVHAYKKVYKSGNYNLCNGSYYNYGYTGGIRQDSINKKVYFIHYGIPETDTLLYDFSKHVGDTLRLSGFQDGGFNVMSYTATIISIDSVLVGSNYHKRFNISSYDGGSIIEGVGATSGLLEGYNMVIADEEMFLLDCFHHSAEFYPTSATGCSTLGLQTFNTQHLSFQISPNPCNSTISVAGNINIDELKVTDMLGQIVYEAKPNTTNTTLTLPDAGVYFITLTSGTTTNTQKVIVSK
jgi:hypothetical protein